MVDFKSFSVDELMTMKEALGEEIKAKRFAARETAKSDKAVRDAKMREKVSEGDKIAFLFNKVRTEGKVVRTSEKSVTVEFDKEGETVKRYRNYSDILEVIGETEDEAVTEVAS